mmetsp:Transcript_516/g.1048  ORF Transcript_516/g.1048 Transcript_516/m.1048 type:complete len:136 (-) Transcript_516:69-476(-)
MQQKLESVSGRYSCGDLLFDDKHHLSRVLVKKQNITCESPIEKGYYNVEGRALKLKPICIHCGEMCSTKTLLGQEQLEQRCLTNGFTCYPICVECLDSGCKILTSGRKNEVKARADSERKAERVKKGKKGKTGNK